MMPRACPRSWRRAGSDPSEITEYNGVAYFRAFSAGSGDELWTSNGTGPGTVLVKDTCAGACSSYPSSLTILGSRPLPGRGENANIVRLEIPYGSFERRIALQLNRLRLAERELANGCLVLTFVKLG